MATRRRRGPRRGQVAAAVGCLATASVIAGTLALELRGGRTAPGDLDPGQRIAKVYGEDVVNALFDTVGGGQLPDTDQLADITLLIGDHPVSPAQWVCAARARLTAQERRLVDAALVEYPDDREVRRKWEIDPRGLQIHVYTASLFSEDVTGFDPTGATEAPVRSGERSGEAQRTAITAGKKVFAGATVVFRGSGGPADAVRTTVRMPTGPTGTCR